MSVRVQTDPIDAASALAAAQPTGDAGAVVSFTGHVRAEPGSDHLTLEHYPGMTEKCMARIVNQARERFSLANATAIHRVGRMMPGETIVLVIAVARHRQAAFDGAQFIMDWLKTEAPFWKQNSDGGWVETRQADRQAQKRWHSDPTG